MDRKQVPSMLILEQMSFPVLALSRGFDASSVVHLRSPLRFVLDGLIPPFNRIVHDLIVTASAAYGSLKPTPANRLRWTYHHLRYSIALTRVHGTRHPPPPRPLGRRLRGKEGDSYESRYAALSEGTCFIGGLTSTTPPQAFFEASPLRTACPAARIFTLAT
jgi:hypothetical protein